MVNSQEGERTDCCCESNLYSICQSKRIFQLPESDPTYGSIYSPLTSGAGISLLESDFCFINSRILVKVEEN